MRGGRGKEGGSKIPSHGSAVIIEIEACVLHLLTSPVTDKESLITTGGLGCLQGKGSHNRHAQEPLGAFLYDC